MNREPCTLIGTKWDKYSGPSVVLSFVIAQKTRTPEEMLVNQVDCFYISFEWNHLLDVGRYWIWYFVLLTVYGHAYSLSQSLDPKNEGRGVLQFKTGLMAVIKVILLL